MKTNQTNCNGSCELKIIELQINKIREIRLRLQKPQSTNPKP